MNEPQDDPIDLSALDVLRSFADDGGEDILSELIDIFLDDTPQRLQQLARAVAAKDAGNVEHQAHSLKSSCAQLGAAQLSDLCRQLEEKGRSGELSGTPELLTQVHHHWPLVKRALHAQKTPSA